ncbi:hypothetical protein ACHAPO_010415 [Fusarium lateritium]
MNPEHPTPFLDLSKRASAISRFEQVLTYFENHNDDINIGFYDKVKLVKFTYEYACNQSSKDLIVLVALNRMGIIDSYDYHVNLDDVDLRNALKAGLYRFANNLLQNFFIPVKAWAGEKARPSSPRFFDDFSLGEDRMSWEMQFLRDCFQRESSQGDRLRLGCLLRDRYRCVISRAFDEHQGSLLYGVSGKGRVTDNGKRVYSPVPDRFDKLEIAHILPPFIFTDGWSEKPGSGSVNRGLLNMIHHGILKQRIMDNDIESIKNALTLSPSLRDAFSQFRIFFDPVEDEEDTYVIKAFPPGINGLPVKRKLSDSYVFVDDLDDHSIKRTISAANVWGDDQPDPRLLAAHRAIGHILHFSATRSPAGGEVQAD